MSMKLTARAAPFRLSRLSSLGATTTCRGQAAYSQQPEAERRDRGRLDDLDGGLLHAEQSGLFEAGIEIAQMHLDHDLVGIEKVVEVEAILLAGDDYVGWIA